MNATYKTIVSGCLEFGNARSYEQVLKLYQHRTENYYRNDILLKAEEVFQEETFILSIPRYIKECTEKSWKNTLNLLEYVAGYAVAGEMKAWVIQDGKMIDQRVIEPDGDKSATQAFIQGREMVKEKGMEEEAMNSLNRAIEKFERHALAYERRGYVNYRLRNYDDAIYDFTKSIDINPNMPDAYWGRANTRVKKNDIQGALADLEMAIAKSIPHQPVYWGARRLKGELHLGLSEFEKAIFELKLVTNRQFNEDDPNFKWQKNVLFNYGKALFEIGQYTDAVKVYNNMIGVELQQDEAPSKAEQLFSRGIARQKAGESGYVNDIKEAAGLGSKKAVAMLAAIA
jgi:tetratricopeptide (TPR) repeat protein